MDSIERKDLPLLFAVLREHGYTVIGPTIRDGAIVLDSINGVDDLPAGWSDEQSGGSYALVRRSDNALFGYVVGPFSWKRFLYQPRQCLFSAKRNGKDITFEPTGGKSAEVPRFAFVGVRPCELSAIGIQDKVFVTGEHADPSYAARRSAALIIAVNCTQPGGNCFCTSMGTGPEAKEGYDIVLTELSMDAGPVYIASTGSEKGKEILAAVPHRPSTANETGLLEQQLENAAGTMGKSLDTKGLKGVLYDNFDHEAWDDVTKRCLACANCTMVCPTCFCSTVEDTTDLDGTRAERWRRWDSCFTMEFARVAGGNTRPSTRARYRQWLMHKLGYWNDQFGVSGCVGCGRCITWCPVGIDITAEAAAIRGGAPAMAKAANGGNSRS